MSAKLRPYLLSGGQYITDSGYLTPGIGPEYSRNLDSDSPVSASAITYLKLQYYNTNTVISVPSL